METTPLYTIKKLQSDFPAINISNSADASKFIRNFYLDDIEVFESFFILLLDRANNTIGYAKISQGGISGTLVDVRLIAKYAVDALASSVILAHNHPSGNLLPSSQDIELTRRVKEGLALLTVNVIEHIILTKDSYYSFADEGRI